MRDNMVAIRSRNFIWVICFLLMAIGLPSLFFSDVHAGEACIIELNDGSVISGEVISFDGHVWTIQSGAMGVLRVDSAKVVNIRSKHATSQVPAGEDAAGNPVTGGDIQAMQHELMADEQAMNMIFSLHDDPDIQAILSDPEIMKAVNAGDVSALLASPKFMKIMENTHIREISKEAGGGIKP